ncbi:MAG: response regulator [Bacteroidetes bacterium]|nr:MAG: response regulator [Bacteroidota bacterium]
MPSRILIVEDDANIEHLVSFKLKNSGFTVFTAKDGQKALDFLSANSVDLIITDMMMPVMDGKELILQLKKQPKTASIPTIMLTSRTLEKEIVEAFSLGVDDYIKKPFSPQELVARIKTVLARRGL